MLSYTLITRVALVLLAGIYAMRSSDWIFGSNSFEPLILLAAAAFCLTIYLFFRMPQQSGAALYAVLALCAAGVAVNALLLLDSGSPEDPTDQIFSLTCTAGWAAVALCSWLAARRQVHTH
jgi:hypothetical protein